MLKETWKSVDGYEGQYEVSNLGNVKTLGRYYFSGFAKKIKLHTPSKIMKKIIDSDGYCVVNLCKDGKKKMHKIHRLVAKAFIPEIPGKPAIDHIDTNRRNNEATNLRWVNPSENSNNPLTLINVGKSNSSVLRRNRNPVIQIDAKSGQILNFFNGVNEAARFMNVSKSAITQACKKRTICKSFKWHYSSKRINQ